MSQLSEDELLQKYLELYPDMVYSSVFEELDKGLIEGSADPLRELTEKPKLELPGNTSTLEGLRHYCVAQLANPDMDTEALLLFLVKKAETMQRAAPVDMSYNNIQIAKQGDMVTPLSWIDINYTGGTSIKTYSTPTNTNKHFDICILMKIFSPIRLLSKSDIRNRELLQDKLQALFAQKLPPGQLYALSPEMFRAPWAQTPSFQLLASCYDMFWTLFPRHETAAARICTLSLRDSELGMLKTMRSTLEATGLALSDLGETLFTGSLINQYKRLTDGPVLSADKEWSYIHYARPFQMTYRSNLSVTACPELYLLCHLIGISLGTERFFNAVMPKYVRIVETMRNAKYIIYSLRRPGGVALLNAKDIGNDKLVIGVSTPEERANLRALIETGRMDREMFKYFAELLARLPAGRPGSIVEEIKCEIAR